ncbi:MAG TPA: hypothetical protein DD429_03720 [Clostridiaceae bacterium]|nr:hypothetical protein [Clostridiaceae bacterium]
MSINIDPNVFQSCGKTADTQNTCGANPCGFRNSPLTIIILILIAYFLGRHAFGGYGNYPGYGGFSPYGYTPRPKRYRYWDDYIMVYEPDI